MRIAPSFAERVAHVPHVLEPGKGRDVCPDGYQQSEPRWNDPEGDAALIRMLDRVPEGVVSATWRHLVHGENWDQRTVDRLPCKIGHDPALHVDELLDSFQQVMESEKDLHPHIGPEHSWSPEAKDYNRFGFWRRIGRWMRGQQDFPAPTVGFSKLFLLLATGYTARFAVTGQEKALTEKLMAFPDRGVSVTDMFRESYRLNQGDVYKTLLTAENILARDPFQGDRQDQPLQAKLAYIRNDEPQVGDNFAAWYHLFGMASYALVRPDILSRGAGEIESFGSLLMEGPDRQEDLINRMAADLGIGLKRMLKDGVH